MSVSERERGNSTKSVSLRAPERASDNEPEQPRDGIKDGGNTDYQILLPVFLSLGFPSKLNASGFRPGLPFLGNSFNHPQ